MALFYLESGGTQIVCPECKSGFDADWNTEYSDPIPDSYSKECPSCDASLVIDVDVITTYTAVLNHK